MIQVGEDGEDPGTDIKYPLCVPSEAGDLQFQAGNQWVQAVTGPALISADSRHLITGNQCD